MGEIQILRFSPRFPSASWRYPGPSILSFSPVMETPGSILSFLVPFWDSCTRSKIEIVWNPWGYGAKAAISRATPSLRKKYPALSFLGSALDSRDGKADPMS